MPWRLTLSGNVGDKGRDGFRSGKFGMQLIPVHQEHVGDRVKDPTCERKRLDPTKALYKHNIAFTESDNASHQSCNSNWKTSSWTIAK